MQKTARLSLKVGLAAASAFALTFGAVAPAFAADIPVGPGDVINYENGDESSAGWNYDQWHIGSNYDPAFPLESSVTFQECTITTLAQTSQNPGVSVVQMLKGFPIDGRPFAGLGAYGGDDTVAAVQALIESTSIIVIEGSVTLQLPIFEYDGLAPAPHTPAFTTVRTDLLGPGVYNLADLSVTDSSGWFGGGTLTMADFLGGMQSNVDDDFYYEILGVGFTGSEGAVVESLGFAGNTYHFGTGSCVPTTPVAPTPPTSVQTAAK